MIKIIVFITSILLYFITYIGVSADSVCCGNIEITLTGSEIDGNFDNEYREYLVDYMGRKYDGIDIEGHIKYKLKDTISFKANHNNEIIVNISNANSHIKDIKINISKRLENNSLESKYNYQKSYQESYQESENENQKEIIIKNQKNIFTKTGDYRLNIDVVYHNGNTNSINTIYNVDFSEYISGYLELIDLQIGQAYADNDKHYEYKTLIRDDYGNILKNIDIINIEHNIENYTGGKEIKINNEEASSDNALVVFGTGSKLDDNGETKFKLKSLAPGFFTQRFKIELEGEKEAIALNNSTNYFNKPFWGELKASNDDGTTWNYIPTIDEEIKYKIEIEKVNTLNNDNTKLFYNTGSIISLNNLTYLTGTTKDNLEFTTTIEKNDEEDLTRYAGISIGEYISKIFISYDLSGKNIRYRLSPKSNYLVDNPLNISNNPEDNTQINIKIIGQSGEGLDNDFQNQIINTSRNEIRQKAYMYISQLEHGQIIGGVKYVNDDYSISGEISDYETLVITNGNLTISDDINTNNKNFGIIVLKDGYNIENGYSGEGNIFVDADVSKINALIYADGAILKNNDNDSNKQLHIKGSLLTRNTIGGAKIDISEQLLPGLIQSNNFDLAKIYDLNFLRNGNVDCIEKVEDDEGDEICKYEEHLIIEYNPNIMSNPPKLFY